VFQKSALRKPLMNWVVPTFTPLMVRFDTLATRGEELKRDTVEMPASQVFGAVESNTLAPIATFSGTITVLTVVPVLVAAKGLVPTIVPERAVLSLVDVIEYMNRGIVVPAAAWNAASAWVPAFQGLVGVIALEFD
jgi:hypothetical protein